MAFAALFQGTVASEHLDVVKIALTTLARECENDPGTIRYEFYQPQNDPTIVILFAIWQNEADWQAHVASDAHDRYAKSLPADAWVIRPVLTKLQPLRNSEKA
jgi:quinol monooxygenase YgiN